MPRLTLILKWSSYIFLAKNDWKNRTERTNQVKSSGHVDPLIIQEDSWAAGKLNCTLESNPLDYSSNNETGVGWKKKHKPIFFSASRMFFPASQKGSNKWFRLKPYINEATASIVWFSWRQTRSIIIAIELQFIR